MSRDDDKTWADLVDTFHASPSSGGDQPWPAAEQLGPDDQLDDLPDDLVERLRADGTARPDAGGPDGGESAQPGDGEQPDGPPAGDYRDASLTLGPLAAVGPGGRPGHDEIPNEDVAVDGSEVSDHFVPPPPAPIPRGDRVTRLAWAGVIAPPIALIIVAVMSWRPPDEMVLFAVAAFVTGFVTLIARMRGHHPGDPDDGAVL
ncbi:hypothetical protein [Jiangella gansuensis]|uniref:hypothetical protein n=1 Tax=Jiangella gansuensis TaxID=281473 RepID=UPI00047940DD|nr:hypothetical protein [Jiangella gansuensis]